MIKDLGVWWDGQLTGVLSIDRHGDLSFTYDPQWRDDAAKPSLSISLPKRAEPFDRRETRPFFAGLLPDEAQRDGVARALGVSAGNDFRLLERLGGDVAGALTLWPAGEAPPAARGLLATAPLGDDDLVATLDRLPARPLLAGEEGMRLSLAGAQAKLPVVMVNGQVALPAAGQPSTHILKPAIARLDGSTENEAFAMRLARAVGLRAAAVEPRRTAGRTYLIVERYDREVTAQGVIRRLHQEDFCQALGVVPERKYAAEGGPVFHDCFDLIRRACGAPAPAMLRLADAAIFNVLVGNADAHGKNFSLLYGSAGIDLAPLYDLMCTSAHPELHAKLAMKIGKRSMLEAFTPDTWEDFAREVGLGAPYVRRRAQALTASVLDEAPRVAEELATCDFGGPAMERVLATVLERGASMQALADGQRTRRPLPRRPR